MIDPRESNAAIPTVVDYFRSQLNSVTLQFRPLQGSPKETANGASPMPLSLPLLRSMSYLEVVSRLAESLGVPDPWRIRLSIKISSYSDKMIVPHENLTLDRILDYGEEHATVPFEEIFYEVLEVSVLELQTKRILKVGWLNSKVQEETTHQVLVSKDGTVLDVWNAFREKLGRTIDDQRVRFLQHLHHRIAPLEFSTPVSSLDGAFYFEEVQPEDLQKGAMDAWVEVVHFQKDPQRRFGIPFYILVREVGSLFVSFCVI